MHINLVALNKLAFWKHDRAKSQEVICTKLKKINNSMEELRRYEKVKDKYESVGGKWDFKHNPYKAKFEKLNSISLVNERESLREELVRNVGERFENNIEKKLYGLMEMLGGNGVKASVEVVLDGGPNCVLRISSKNF
jgi:hypothetical protein